MLDRLEHAKLRHTSWALLAASIAFHVSLSSCCFCLSLNSRSSNSLSRPCFRRAHSCAPPSAPFSRAPRLDLSVSISTARLRSHSARFESAPVHPCQCLVWCNVRYLVRWLAAMMVAKRVKIIRMASTPCSICTFVHARSTAAAYPDQEWDEYDVNCGSIITCQLCGLLQRLNLALLLHNPAR
jgi:hypothetical protein